MYRVILQNTRHGTRIWCNDGSLRYWGFLSDPHAVRFATKQSADKVARLMHGRAVHRQELRAGPRLAWVE